MGTPCDICGDDGVIEAIITCCECKISRQHLYCMRLVRTEAPPFWLCEECERKKLFSPTKNDKEQIPELLTKKVSSFIPKNTTVLKSSNKNGLASRFNFKEKRVDTGRTKYISCEEVVKLSSGGSKSESPSKTAFKSKNGSSKSMPPPREKSLAKIYGATKFDPHLQQFVVHNKGDAAATKSLKSTKSSRGVELTTKETEMKKTARSEVMPLLPIKEEVDDIKVPKSSKKVEITKTKADTDMGIKNGNLGEPNVTKGVPLSEIQYNSIPALHSYWKGSFNLPNEYETMNAAFKAHPPSTVHCKVYETLKKMPENINFELAPIHQVYSEIFPSYCPDKDDIGLYFFPRFKNRCEKDTSLMEFLWSKNMVMKSHVNEAELLVLSSKFLKVDSQEIEGNYFLWGVFRANKVKRVTPSKSKVVDDSCGKRGGVDVTLLKCAECPPGFEKLKKPPPPNGG